jgi:hypothetical protein
MVYYMTLSGGKVTRYSYGLDGRNSIPGRSKINIYSTESRSTLVPYTVGTVGVFPRGVKLMTHLYHVPRSVVEPYLHSPHTSSWRGACLIKNKEIFAFFI